MLVIVCAGVVLASLDLFIVNVALPQIGKDFHLRGGGLSDLSWVLNGYAIVYAAFLVLFGRIAERYRRERAFLLGVAVFVAASAACGAADQRADAGGVSGRAGRRRRPPDSDITWFGPGCDPAQAPAQRGPRLDGGRWPCCSRRDRWSGGVLVALSWRWVFLVNVPGRPAGAVRRLAAAA